VTDSAEFVACNVLALSYQNDFASTRPLIALSLPKILQGREKRGFQRFQPTADPLTEDSCETEGDNGRRWARGTRSTECSTA